jgi:hypothetical protein
VPKNIIKPEEMKQIMWDVMRADALAQQYVKSDSTLNDSTQTKILTQKVFELHGIKAEDFGVSYAWYIKNPGTMKTMFDSLYEQKRRSNIEIHIPQNQISKDSMPEKNILFEKKLKSIWTVDSLKKFRK